MSKKLSEMTLEELWKLFPISLVEPKAEWAEWYKEQERSISTALSNVCCRISHVGSTAIKGVWAKNIVDILVEVEQEEELRYAAERLKEIGYLIMSSAPDRISLNRGYTEQGFAEKVFHLHLRLKGDHDELYFRDYLNDHPDVAKEYERMKFGLWKQYEHDRDGYTNAKSDFIRRYTALAKEEYGLRYSQKAPEQ